MTTDPNIERLLHFDPLAEAERITGQSYKDDQSTIMLGMAMNMEHGARKREALAAAGDSHRDTSFDGYTAIMVDLGFVYVHSHCFPGNYGRETFMVMWHDDGILAVFESFTWSALRDAPTVNSAKIYYNFRYDTTAGWWPGGSGSAADRDETGDMLTWSGDKDVREGVRHVIADMRDHGEFLNPWVGIPFLWLLDYSQTRVDDYDYTKINADVLSKLPENVRDAIAGGTR